MTLDEAILELAKYVDRDEGEGFSVVAEISSWGSAGKKYGLYRSNHKPSWIHSEHSFEDAFLKLSEQDHPFDPGEVTDIWGLM